jgi:maltooligosyltrehalose trehalohydrolase
MIMKIGANYLGDKGCEFTVWAPFAKDVALAAVGDDDRAFPMERDDMGYWHLLKGAAKPGTRYIYRLNGALDRPDPASYYQPDGIHQPSQVIDHGAFVWDDFNWASIPLEKMIFYELHVGTFTPEGTFEGVITKLSRLKYLGVNTIELMPVAQFPGVRNWGYDGVHPFAVQNSYGGPDGLKRLVDVCHQKGLAVVLDVVYNHLGPEGNYLADFAPYFTDEYKTPWSQAINFDGPYSYGVRNYFIENALYWFRNFHLDGLRLDATHGIFDFGARHILEELAQEVEKLSQDGRKRYLIAESNLNDVKVLKSREYGGYGLDAQWSDDFHHSLHALLTGERDGYYVDFGRPEQIAKAFKEAFVYTGDYSFYRKRYHGSPTNLIPAWKFVVFSQNHDQVGNRMRGDRLSGLVPFEALKLVAGAVLVSPYVPLLFMGEEHGETNPFCYFIDHSDPALTKAVIEGRKKEFAAFGWKEEPPDPALVETFLKSKIDWENRDTGKSKAIFEFYRELIRIRGTSPALATLDKDNLTVKNYEWLILLQRGQAEERIVCLMNFGDSGVEVRVEELDGRWIKIIDSSDWQWWGPGSKAQSAFELSQKFTVQPYEFLLYQKES